MASVSPHGNVARCEDKDFDLIRLFVDNGFSRCREVRCRNIEPNRPTRNNPVGWGFRKISYAVGQIRGNDRAVMCGLFEKDVASAIVTVGINCEEIPSTANLYY